jgi:hypothetical protein
MYNFRITLAFAACGVAISMFTSVAQAGDSKVNCSSPGANGKISNVLSRLNPADTNVVRVSGHCHENLVIQGFDRLSLIAEPGAVIEDASGGQLNVVYISDSQRVVIQGFTIQGGSSGVVCNNFSFCHFIGDTVEGTKTGPGIVVGGSQAQFNNILVRDTAGDGIFLYHSKSTGTNVSITDTAGTGMVLINSDVGGGGNFTIQRTKGDGIYAQSTSHLDLSPLKVTDAGGNGVWIARGSSADMYGVTIANNQQTGVLLHLGSTASIGDGNVTNNASGGIVVMFESNAYINGTVVTNNQGAGLSIDQVSYALVLGASFSGPSGGGNIVCGPQVAQVNVDADTHYDNLYCPVPPASALIKPRP